MRARVQARVLLDEAAHDLGDDVLPADSRRRALDLADAWTALAMVEAVERVAEALERLARHGGRL